MSPSGKHNIVNPEYVAAPQQSHAATQPPSRGITTSLKKSIEEGRPLHKSKTRLKQPVVRGTPGGEPSSEDRARSRALATRKPAPRPDDIPIPEAAISPFRKRAFMRALQLREEAIARGDAVLPPEPAPPFARRRQTASSTSGRDLAGLENVEDTMMISTDTPGYRRPRGPDTRAPCDLDAIPRELVARALQGARDYKHAVARSSGYSPAGARRGGLVTFQRFRGRGGYIKVDRVPVMLARRYLLVLSHDGTVLCWRVGPRRELVAVTITEDPAP